MSTEQPTAEAMALAAEASSAQALWQSTDPGLSGIDDGTAALVAARRAVGCTLS
jgi:hypothetical protein